MRKLNLKTLESICGSGSVTCTFPNRAFSALLVEGAVLSGSLFGYVTASGGSPVIDCEVNL